MGSSAQIRRVSLSAGILLSSFGAAYATCAPDVVDLRGAWGRATFTVEVADTDVLRGVGLMNRESMPRGAGMLFVYDSPRPVAFWMRNTLIPLDMIFIGPDGVVRRVHENAIPLDETTIQGGPGIQHVLEINGGLSDVFGIAEGTEVRHPRIEADGAVWPCE